MTDQEYITQRKKTALKLKHEAMEVAALLETIAHENDATKVKAAQRQLRDHIDGYWHAIKIGNSTELGEVLED